MTDVERLKELGGTVGSVLIGTDNYDTRIIMITAIGEESILARRLTKEGDTIMKHREISWTLEYRDWKIAELNEETAQEVIE